MRAGKAEAERELREVRVGSRWERRESEERQMSLQALLRISDILRRRRAVSLKATT